MNNSKIDPEMAAHNIATIITHASISNFDLDNLGHYSAGNSPQTDKIVELSKKFYDIYQKIYEDSYQYYKSKRD